MKNLRAPLILAAFFLFMGGCFSPAPPPPVEAFQPSDLSFVAEQEANAGRITAVFTNNSRYFAGHSMVPYLEKQIDNDWHRAPFAGNFIGWTASMEPEEERSFTIIMDEPFDVNASECSALYVEPLAPGMYRIGTHVEVFYIPDEFNPDRTVVWSDIVWAEFEIAQP